MPDVTELEKIPPQNLEAEKSLLGSILLDKDAMIKIADGVDIEDFYKKAHQNIFETMHELYNKNEPIDVLTMSNRMDEKKLLEKSGGRTYLAELSNSVPTSSHIKKYATIVRRKSTLRRLLQSAHEISQLGYNESAENVDQILDEAQQSIFGVTQTHMKQSFTPIKNVLSGTFERIDELHREKGKLRGIPSGFKQLDNILAGFQKSDLVIIAARPSVGKTSLALDFARHAAVRGKMSIGLFSLEMSKEQLVDRLLCAEAGIDLWKMRTGNLSDNPNSDDFPRIGHAMGVLSESKIFIDDNANSNVMQIRTKARRLQAEHGLDMIIIDYLQLMNSHSKRNSDNRVQEVAEMSRNLKGIARELNVPVLALSQLSRAVEQTKPAIPKLSHLRDSGSIEQDADVVMFIYRKSADRNYRPEDIPPDEQRIGEIHIAKHRNGPTGVVRVFFDAERASFRSLDSNLEAPLPKSPVPEQAQPQKQNVPKF
ncbi:replicative DNA helicase [Candidatus Parcubacteria bacterium]|jgi:replicative DNA helicase|nr:replicative DNA helicase [Candidatus Parcubacteria bacterium]